MPDKYVEGQLITSTLRENYMPYAMSVILSRAIPEIDGFKPSHRKLLYTMYKMGLMTGPRMKSAKIAGATMSLNPHGDAAIYETMVRMSRGNETLLYPFVDSKGSFGKVYSRDMAYAASRYTEAKLAPICAEVFANIDKNNVDFVRNFDNTMDEPVLLPVTFPNILANPNQGIAVGMASNICSFNLDELCRTTAALMRDPNHPIETTLLAPDFSTGGILLYNENEIKQIYETGRGSFKLRAKYAYDKKSGCIDISEIPYTTSCEAIIEKITALVKAGGLKEIKDVRDETDINGLKITIDVKNGTDPDLLMAKLFKSTPLEDSFSCNFNVLVKGQPAVRGVREILTEWAAFRTDCFKRELEYDAKKKKQALHLLLGLKKILLDIDKAISIIKDTEAEAEVVPNLMIGFGIDEKQAEYIADIKLRSLNRQYVIKKIEEVDALKNEIADLEAMLGSRTRIRNAIIAQLEKVAKKYSQPRKTQIVFAGDIKEVDVEEKIDDYEVNIFITEEGYFKKITPLSLRMGGDHKLKEGDRIAQTFVTTNAGDIIVITDRYQAYKAHIYDFSDCKASVMGDYLPAKLGFEEGEKPIYSLITKDYKGCICFFYEDGRVAKVPLSSFETKTNRKKLTGAYSAKQKLVFADSFVEETQYVMTATNGKTLIVNSAMIPSKAKRDTMGVKVLELKGKNTLYRAERYRDGMFVKPDKYKTKNIPAVGTFISADDKEASQLTLE